MSNSEGLQGDDLTRAATGFNAAISVWKLASQQIYSRFSAMLIANSIVFGAASFAAGSKGIPPALLPALCGCGLVLCAAWILLIKHGSTEEGKDMNRVRRLQLNIIPKGEEIVSEKHKRFSIYKLGMGITIGVFIFLYSSVLCYSWHLYCSYLFGLFKG